MLFEISLLGLLLVVVYLLRLPLRFKYRKLPGEFYNLPIFGHFLAYNQDKLNYEVNLMKKYPQMFFQMDGADPLVVITDPDLFRKAASLEYRQLKLSDIMTASGVSNEFENNNIFTSNDEFWREQRNMLNPAFVSASVRTYTEGIKHYVNEECIFLEEKSKSGEPLDLLSFTKDLTIQVIMKAAFGVDLSLQNKDDIKRLEELKKVSQAFFQVLSTAGSMDMVKIFPELGYILFNITKLTGTMDIFNEVRLKPGKVALQIIHDKGQQSGTEGLSKPESVGKDQVEDNFTSKTAKGSSLQNFPDWQKYRGPGLLMELLNKGTILGNSLGDLQKCSNLTILLLAGHETTATTLAFSLYELARSKKLQEELIREVDSFGRDKDITEQDLDQFLFAKAIINESLRLYTPLINTYRRTKDQSIKLGDHVIPPQTTIILPLRGMHLNERYWPKPREFHPSRWMGNKDLECRSKNAFFPFGYGPRICIGYRLAYNEALIALVKIFSKYTFEPSSPEIAKKPIELGNSIVIYSKNELLVNVKKRE